MPARSSVAFSCIEAGYLVVPAVQDRASWVVEIPMSVPWAGRVGDKVNLEELPVTSQFGLYMMVQKEYTDHNTSGTIELYADEAESLAALICSSIGNGYISVSLSPRSKNPICYPQMPIEPITADQYATMMDDVRCRRASASFDDSIRRWDALLGEGYSGRDYGIQCDCIAGTHN